MSHETKPATPRKPLSDRKYLIPVAQAASISIGAAGCLGGSLKGEWELVEVDGKDAATFYDFGSYSYYVGWYGYYDGPSARRFAAPLGPARAVLPIDVAPTDGDGAQDCQAFLGIELEMDIDERDGDEYEGEAEGGPIFSVVCDGNVVYTYSDTYDGDVEAEAKGKGDFDIEIDLDGTEFELECELDGDELDCEVDDGYASDFLFQRKD